MRLVKIAAGVLLLFILLCAVSFFTDQASFGQWTVKQNNVDSSGVAWAPFVWGSSEFSGRHVERTAMMIPAHIEGLPNPVALQFDLGTFDTELYETSLRSATLQYPQVAKSIGRLKGPLQFWNGNKALKNLTLKMGNLQASSPNGFVHRAYGDTVFVKSESDTLHLGTVGTDMFQNRVLIIDYPRNRFAICDSVPLRFFTSFVPFELDRLRRVILPMQVGGKTFRILFDNGSSMFPLITPRGNISRFSTEVETDSFRIRSWGQAHWVKGRTLKEPFRLAGQTFAGTTIYADGREYNLSAFDGIAGNALFWNKTLVIDFRNKRFGVK